MNRPANGMKRPINDNVANNGLKTCSKCGESFAVSMFYSKGTGLESRCKLCISIIKSKKYANRKQIKTQKRVRPKNSVVDISNFKVELSCAPHPQEQDVGLIYQEFARSLLWVGQGQI